MTPVEFYSARLDDLQRPTFELVPYECAPGCCAPDGWVGHRCLICGTTVFGGTVEAITEIALGHDESMHQRAYVLADLAAKRAVLKHLQQLADIEWTGVTRVLDQPTSNCSTRSGQQSNCTTGHQYLVFTDHGTYKDTDSLWFFKFNSSDLIGQLREGHTYRCDTTGFRFALGSSYRNLIHCTEATSP